MQNFTLAGRTAVQRPQRMLEVARSQPHSGQNFAPRVGDLQRGQALVDGLATSRACAIASPTSSARSRACRTTALLRAC